MVPAVPGKLPAAIMPMREPGASRRVWPVGLSQAAGTSAGVPGKSTQSALAMLAGAMTWYCAWTLLAPAARV